MINNRKSPSWYQDGLFLLLMSGWLNQSKSYGCFWIGWLRYWCGNVRSFVDECRLGCGVLDLSASKLVSRDEQRNTNS
ncbi:MAG: hypothetical protein JWP57_2231 [Spirosoma sp.]|nr:hypothetical protein [Spirosoma sp.]